MARTIDDEVEDSPSPCLSVREQLDIIVDKINACTDILTTITAVLTGEKAEEDSIIEQTSVFQKLYAIDDKLRENAETLKRIASLVGSGSLSKGSIARKTVRD